MTPLLFGGALVIVVVFGRMLIRTATVLGESLRMGQALFGAFILAALTSLGGLVTSITAAHQGAGALAVGNAVGGICAQTAALAVADFFHKRTNLEHAAASPGNLVHGCLLMILLAIALLGTIYPNWVVGWVHPVSLVMVAVFLFGIFLSKQAEVRPMWRPLQTAQTSDWQPTTPPSGKRNLLRLSFQLSLAAAAVGCGGWLMATNGIRLASATGLTGTFIGAFFTATAASFPEIMTTITAVRRGALNLAVGGILGGNVFDTLTLAAADAAYTDGPIYMATSEDVSFLMTLTLIMTGVLILGLLVRQQHGFANIGFESLTVLALYITGIVVLL